MNIIETAMREKELDPQGAIDYAGELVHGRIRTYLEAKAKLPKWDTPAIAEDVAQYCRVMECWCVAGFEWSLTSVRYFGDKVREVRETLQVEVFPNQEPRGQEVVPGL